MENKIIKNDNKNNKIVKKKTNMEIDYQYNKVFMVGKGNGVWDTEYVNNIRYIVVEIEKNKVSVIKMYDRKIFCETFIEENLLYFENLVDPTGVMKKMDEIKQPKQVGTYTNIQQDMRNMINRLKLQKSSGISMNSQIPQFAKKQIPTAKNNVKKTQQQDINNSKNDNKSNKIDNDKGKPNNKMIAGKNKVNNVNKKKLISNNIKLDNIVNVIKKVIDNSNNLNRKKNDNVNNKRKPINKINKTKKANKLNNLNNKLKAVVNNNKNMNSLPIKNFDEERIVDLYDKNDMEKNAKNELIVGIEELSGKLKGKVKIQVKKGKFKKDKNNKNSIFYPSL